MKSFNRIPYVFRFGILIASTTCAGLAAEETLTVASVPQTSQMPQPAEAYVDLIQLEPLSNSSRCPVVTAMAMHPSSETFAAAGDDHAIRWIDLRNGKILAVLEGHEDWVRQIRFVPTDDGSLALLSCGDDGKLIAWRWDFQAAEPSVTRSVIMQSQHTLSTLCLDSTGKQFAAGGFSHEIYLGSIDESQEPKVIRCECGDQRALLFAPDGKTLFAGGRDGHLHIIDTAQAKVVDEKHVHHSRLRSLALSEDGQILTSVGEDRLVVSTLWQTGQQVLSMKLNAGKLLAVEHLDADRLAIASADNTVQIIDAKTGEEINKLVGHDGSVAVLLYQNERLFTAGFDTTIRIWNLDQLQSKTKSAKLIRHPIQSKFLDSGVNEVTN